jgi:(2Fe-2S) ferredoxin
MEKSNIDMTSPMAGTVKHYTQHLVICSGESNWPSKIKDAGGFTAALVEGIKTPEFSTKPRVTACAAPSQGSGTDILIYPLQIRVNNLTTKDIPKVIRLLQGDSSHDLEFSPVQKPLFLVCGHQNRDQRCGRCGPNLLTAIQGQLADMDNPADAYLSSHLGGHRFAGVVVAYPSGNWYGRVTETEIPMLIKAELVEKKPLTSLWRGRIGLTIEEQKSHAANQD